MTHVNTFCAALCKMGGNTIQNSRKAKIMSKILSTLALASATIGVVALSPVGADAAPKKNKACFVNGIRMSPDNCEERRRLRGDQARPLTHRQHEGRRFNFGSDPEFGRDRGGGGGDGGGAGNRSDVRLKRDIEVVGRLANGLKLYRFKYLWSDVEWVGVMAQDVLDVMPEAVIVGSDGFYRVQYELLGTSMVTFDEWQALNEVDRPWSMAA